jgi:hypothetical protein
MNGDDKKTGGVGDGPPAGGAEQQPVGNDSKPASDWQETFEKLQAEAAASIPDIKLDDDCPAEVKSWAALKVKGRRLLWVAKKLQPPQDPELDPTNFQVGQVGRVNVLGRVVRVDNGVLVLSVPKGRFDRAMFAVSGVDTSTVATDHEYPVYGRYEAYRTGKFGVYTLVVLRSASTDGRQQWRYDRVVEMLEKLKPEISAARDAHAVALKAATEAATAEAKAEAEKRFPLSKTGTVQEQVKAKRDREEGEAKLVREAVAKVQARYAEPH